MDWLIPKKGNTKTLRLRPGAVFMRENDGRIHTIRDGGVIYSAPISKVQDMVTPTEISTGSNLLPNGIRGIIPYDHLTFVVHETPPGVRPLWWPLQTKPPPRGGVVEHSNRIRHISLPYVITIIPMTLGGMPIQTEVFFRNEPLHSLEDKILFPALLNCGRYGTRKKGDNTLLKGRLLSPLCNYHEPLMKKGNISDDLVPVVKSTVKNLFESGFNYDMDVNCGDGWFEKTRRELHPKYCLGSIEAWEEASKANPFFALDVPWLPTKLSLKKLLDREYKIHNPENWEEQHPFNPYTISWAIVREGKREA